jgi:hypothetical protein
MKLPFVCCSARLNVEPQVVQISIGIRVEREAVNGNTTKVWLAAQLTALER